MEWTRGRRQGTRPAHPYEWPKMSFFPEEACELSYAMAWLSAALIIPVLLFSVFSFFSVPRACSFFLLLLLLLLLLGGKENEEEEDRWREREKRRALQPKSHRIA